MKDITIIHKVVLAEEIWDYFNDVIEGMGSDIAYYELFQYVESYFEGNKKDFFSWIDCCFGIDKKHFKNVLKNYKKSIKRIKGWDLI